MGWLRLVLSRLRGQLTRRAANGDLDQEIDEHLRSLVARFVREGMARDKAEHAARLRFGNVTQLQAKYREAQGVPWIENCVRDLLFGLRLLTKRPAFSVIVIAVLALGIGANTAVYSVARAVAFAPLPFPQPDRLVLLFEGDVVGERFQIGNLHLSSVRPGSFQDWRAQSHSFESMAATTDHRATITDGVHASVVHGYGVGDGFFETLGVPARLGRCLTAADYTGNGSRVIVLADRMWRERFNADPAIVGRDIFLDGAAYRVAGVMPPRFFPTAYGNDPEFWIPVHWDTASSRSFVLWGYFVYARLKDGVTPEQAQSEMDVIAAQMRTAHPADFEGGVVVAPLNQYLFGHHERYFSLLLVAVGLVLLIACANVANLLLTQALKRRREFAVRSALGASRAVILRQVLAESLMIALAGGLLGAALSPLLIRPVLALLPAGNLPRLDQIRMDPNILAFTALISILAGMVFGMVPALRAGRGDLSLTLRAAGRGNSAAASERRIGDALMIAEIALSLVLLVGAGLLTRTFLKLVHTDPGFRPERAVAVRLAIPAYRYGTYEEGGRNVLRREIYRRIEESAQSLPGIQMAALTRHVPILQFWNPDGLSIEGRPPTIKNGTPAMLKRWGIPDHGMISYQVVSPGYFAAVGIPLVRGRLFDSRDREDAPPSALVNQAMARKFFPDEDPMGRQIAVDRGTTFLRRMTIVGIVADARLDGVDQAALPEVFAAMDQLPSSELWIVARAKGDAALLGRALEKAVHDIDPEIGVIATTTLTAAIDDSLWRERLSAVLMGLFGVVATLIAMGGLYAVVSRAVEQRTQEIGVRLALGANRKQITQTVLGHAFRVTLISIVAGSLLTLLAGKLLSHQAYDLHDLPWMFSAVAGLLCILTLAASLVPLRRALAVDPVTALRSE